MHPEPTDKLQQVFRALSDPTRRDILLMLSDQDMTIADVSSRFDMTRAAVKKHLTILREGALISVRTEGRTKINHLEPTALLLASQWLNHFDRFWDERLNALQDAISKNEDLT